MEQTNKMRKHILIFLLVTALLFSESTYSQSQHMVRLALIEVDSMQVLPYTDFLDEEIEASIKKEPGVITLVAVAERLQPERVTIFETYADSSQYIKHLATPHFQKYKQGTQHMVRQLELIETQPLLYNRKSKLNKVNPQKLFIRLIKLKIDPAKLDEFRRLAQEIMLPGIKKENGVLFMYAVSEKKEPYRISILEIYADQVAYENHLKTPHFKQYKTASQTMVTSSKMIDVKPIRLGAKSR